MITLNQNKSVIIDEINVMAQAMNESSGVHVNFVEKWNYEAAIWANWT